MYGQNSQANAKVVLRISTSDLHGPNSISKQAAATGSEVCRKKAEHSEGEEWKTRVLEKVRFCLNGE